MPDSTRSAPGVLLVLLLTAALLLSALLAPSGVAYAGTTSSGDATATAAEEPADEPAVQPDASPEPSPEPEVRTFVRRSRVLGRSVQDRPLRAFYRGDPQARRVTMVIGSMHGNERAGTATVRWMKRHTRPRAGTGVWLLPTMNPDGARLGRRQNARGVDLNRNWPTSGFSSASSSCCYGGPRPLSEPETRAVKRFLARVQPRRVVSIHQPYRTVAANGKSPRFERRLARLLRLPLDEVGVGNPDGTLAPTMSSWFNDTVDRGTMVTVEYAATTTRAYRTTFAGRAVQRALGLGTEER